MKAKHVYIVTVTTFYKDDEMDCTISQEAYKDYEKAVKFCESRYNSCKVKNAEDIWYAPESDRGSRIQGYGYQILELTLV